MDADHRTGFSKRKTKPNLSLEAHTCEPTKEERGEEEEEEEGEEEEEDEDDGSESEGLLPPRRGGTTADSDSEAKLPRKVRWNDRHGHELAEVLVFQPSDESDSDDDESDFCSCTVM